MTIASVINRVGYTGNGAVSTYSYTFRIFQESDLLVTVRNTDGLETTLALTTDYTVAGEGDLAGGSISLVNSSQAWLTSGFLTSGFVLSIRRVVDITQETDLRNQGEFFPESHEDEFDKLVMTDQQQQDEIDRSFKLPETINPSDFDASLPPDITDTDSAGKAIVVNATADGLELSTTSFAGADALFLRDIVYLTFSNSPYTIAESQRGSFFSVDTSGGAVTINLPAISGLDLTEAFALAVRKQTSDANAVTITPNGSETMDKVAASKTLAAQNQGFILVPDKDPSPDDWQSLGFREVACTGTPVGTTDTQTLTNKSLQDSTTFIVDNVDATKKFQFQASGITTATTRTFTVPNADTTLVGTDVAQVLTAKDYDGGTASNTSRMTIPKDTLANLTALTRKAGTIVYATDTDKFYKDNGSTLVEVGSGSSGINYITNPNFESATTGYATYADAAGTSPVDGTGGSPVVTITRSTSSPLRGVGMGVITKGATNRQGDGVSYDFTIDAADKAKVLNVSFDYAVSAAFVSGDSSDVRVWVYDVTNAVLIPVAPYTIQGGTGNNFKFTGVFQTASNSTSYRLILHVATTNASAWTMNIDNLVVGPQVVEYGSPIGDWTAYTPTFTGFGTVTNVGAFYRRVGDSIQVVANWRTGTVAAVGASVSVPSGFSLDTTKLNVNDNSNPGPLVGIYSQDGVAGAYGPLITATSTSTTVVMFGATVANSNHLIQVNGSSAMSSTANASLSFMVPIAGWSSTVLMSNDTDTRVVAARYTYASGQNVTNGSTDILNFATLDFDTHNAVTTGASWKFTAPVPGIYRVSADIVSDANTNTAPVTLDLYKNGSLYSDITRGAKAGTTSCAYQLTGSTSIKLAAGDYIDIRLENGSGGTLAVLANVRNSWVAIERLSGPSAIAAAETVAARYTVTSAATPSNGDVINFNNKDYDTHGAVTTGATPAWKFTAPIPGTYRVSALLNSSGNAANTVAQVWGMRIQKNSSDISEPHLFVVQNTGSIPGVTSVVTCVKLLAGDTIRGTLVSTLSNAYGLGTNGNQCHIEIERIGN